MKCQSNLSNLIKGMRQHQGWRLHNCSDQPDPVFDHLHSTKVIYFMFKLSSCVSFNAYCLLSFHWAPMRRSSYLFMCINKIPTSLFQAKKTHSSLWLFSYVPIPSSSLWHFFSLTPICPWLEMYFHQCWAERVTSLNLLKILFLV